MNQDQVKEQLLRLRDDVEEFFLIFSGKSSKKVNGLYHPDTREIIIHNKNFENDNSLIYTAIHEFAHHIHFTTSPVPVGPRAHTLEFRSILHHLLERAEQVGVYRSPFEEDPEFMAMTYTLKTRFLAKNGQIMKEFGAALAEAERLCRARGARFDDYIERVLNMDRKTASTLIKIHSFDLNPEIGYNNMATVAGFSNQEKRQEAQRQFEAGKSPDTVKVGLRARSDEQQEDPVRKLEKERTRIQRTIHSLESKLSEVEQRLQSLSHR
ncbi:MAG: hypothetical protein ACLFP4_07375 [Spirochaetales bacterium]